MQVGKTSNYPMAGKLAALSVFTIAGTSIQLLYPTVYTTWHCVTLALLLYFLLLAEFDSSFDELTCLYNRAAFDQAVRQMGASEPFSLIMLDIDDFKAINDTYGHDCGDGVIKTIAAVIRASFGKGYTCYRVGGDEFSIIGGETEKAGLERQLEQFATNLAAARTPGQLLPTVSYGYSIFPGGSRLDFSQVRQEADDQMYRCKRTHKAEDAQSQAGK